MSICHLIEVDKALYFLVNKTFALFWKTCDVSSTVGQNLHPRGKGRGGTPKCRNTFEMVETTRA
jgi:hypothetical protein